MEWKIYEEWLDITLYRQMTNLIYKLSSNEEKYKIYMQLKENDMFLEKPKVDMANSISSARSNGYACMACFHRFFSFSSQI